MADLRLTFACGPFDRTQALRNGTVQPEGIELIWRKANHKFIQGKFI
jgi:4,5-dihydroxyphthalate decarboxylase